VTDERAGPVLNLNDVWVLGATNDKVSVYFRMNQ
jgi:hypothetical protein